MAISTAFSPSDRARGVGIKTSFSDLRAGNVQLLPQKLAVIGQFDQNLVPSPSLDPLRVTTALQVGETYGFGSPLYYAAQELFPVNGDNVGTIPVTIYPVADNFASLPALSEIIVGGAVNATGTATLQVNFHDQQTQPFDVNLGDSRADVAIKIIAAVNAAIDAPVVAAIDGGNPEIVQFTSKWKGISANQYLSIDVAGDTTITGLTYAVGITFGTASPDVSVPLSKFLNRWETMVLNCLSVNEPTVLDAYQAFGETRWSPLERKPLIVFTGYAEESTATAAALGDTRKLDRINSLLYYQSSDSGTMRIGARMLSPMIRIANENPPRDYGSLQMLNLLPGNDLDYATRDLLLKSGISTHRFRNDSPVLADIITTFHPDGDQNPSYRYVVDIVKLQNIIYNMDLIFDTPEWDGAPLIPDNQPTTNRDAKKPKAAVAAIAAMLDSLGLQAIINDPATAKENTFAEIDAFNPKRLNISVTVQLSSNTNIISIDLNFGFFFGTEQVI